MCAFNVVIEYLQEPFSYFLASPKWGVARSINLPPPPIHTTEICPWGNWNVSNISICTSLSVSFSLACRCANATREREWKIFGLQFYGECWSGENGETTFKKYGNAKSSSCLQQLVNPIPPCDINKDMECVGARNTNYIYRLKDCKWINNLIVNYFSYEAFKYRFVLGFPSINWNILSTIFYCFSLKCAKDTSTYWILFHMH